MVYIEIELSLRVKQPHKIATSLRFLAKTTVGKLFYALIILKKNLKNIKQQVANDWTMPNPMKTKSFILLLALASPASISFVNEWGHLLRGKNLRLT